MELAAVMPLSPPAFALANYRTPASPIRPSSTSRVKRHGFTSMPEDTKSGLVFQNSWALPLGVAAATGFHARRCRTRGLARNVVGPKPPEMKMRETVRENEVGARTSYMVLENKGGIEQQMQQYGFCQIDGFLGAENGYADKIRDEMKRLFDRGWFEEESHSGTKVGPVKLTNNDTENRFVCKVQAFSPSDSVSMGTVENQYEIAPTLINFIRSFLVASAAPLGQIGKCVITQEVAHAEMAVLCGQGARYDRRADNVYGWNTRDGFVPDPRKYTIFYFANPKYKEEHGGHLQLEGVVTPSGSVSIAPIHDRLVIFSSEKTAWSIRPCNAPMISDYQYTVMMRVMCENPVDNIQYDPVRLQQFWPELRGQSMEMPEQRPAATIRHNIM